MLIQGYQPSQHSQIIILIFESSNVYMYHDDEEQNERVGLNESKFMTEQVNWDQQPTEEEIIQKAQELDIDDYQLAKEALVKELDPLWRPYLNRYGDVYYINLEEKKGFMDHPIDMEYKITYALRYKKKVPLFKQYTLDQISEDTRIIMREIKDFERQKGLNIVYEQSDEESIRRKTLRSNQQEQYEQLKELDLAVVQRQINQYRLQMQREIKKQMAEYRKQKENQYKNRVKKHQDYIAVLKKARLQDISDVYSQQIEQKNKINYQKTIQNTIADLLQKKIKYEDTLSRQIDLVYELQSHNDTKINYKRLSKQRIVNRKRKQRDETYLLVNAYEKKRIMSQIYEQEKQFNRNVQAVTAGKINYQKIVDRNLEELNRQPQIKVKKRYPIFQNETVNKYKEITQKQIQPTSVPKIQHEQVWSKNYFKNDFISVSKPSLPLRLIKRIL